MASSPLWLEPSWQMASPPTTIKNAKEKGAESQTEPIQSQPTATPPMDPTQIGVGRGFRNVRNLPYDEEGKRDWSVSLFGCFSDIGTCCLATWCPCLAHARNRRRLDHLNRHSRPDPRRNRVLPSEEGFAYLLLNVACDMGWVLQVATRRNIRERYSIRGSTASDCMVPYCCAQCDIVQASREMELEEDAFTGEVGVGEGEGHGGDSGKKPEMVIQGDKDEVKGDTKGGESSSAK